MVNSNGDFTYFMGQDLFSDEDNYVIFSDLSITDGSSYLFIDITTLGDPIHMETFEYYLERKIEALEIQKKILNSNYFDELENN